MRLVILKKVAPCIINLKAVLQFEPQEPVGRLAGLMGSYRDCFLTGAKSFQSRAEWNCPHVSC